MIGNILKLVELLPFEYDRTYFESSGSIWTVFVGQLHSPVSEGQGETYVNLRKIPSIFLALPYTYIYVSIYTCT